MRAVVLGCLLASGCYSGGAPLEGLAKTPAGDGPEIVWDLFHQPLPDIPFPNDVATRPDPTAATGRRVNAPQGAPTQVERSIRRHLDDLDGFGTFAPISLRFTQRLDLARIKARQRGDADFADDVVLVIDVTRGSPGYGEAQVLDFGNGNFPITLEHTDVFFDQDPRAHASNIMVDTTDEDVDGDGVFDVFEDTNQDGVLDPGEDQDGDGKLDGDEDTDGDHHFDKPNVWGEALADPSRTDPYKDLIDFYELETDTLWFRPVAPLREQTTYAVVVMSDLVGEDGAPVRSPFPWVNHLQQTAALRPLVHDGLLGRYGKNVGDIAFAWTFTTQSITETLVHLREGLHGVGPFAHLQREYPPEVDFVAPMTDHAGIEAYLLRPADIADALELIFGKLDVGGFNPDRVASLTDTYGAVDYVVAGDYTSPDFLAQAGGVFDTDLAKGTGTHVPGSLRFLLIVPKAEYGPAPFPVAFYCHGYKSLKLEAMAFAGFLAKFGIATFVTDAYNHGLPVGGDFDPLIEQALEQFGASGLTPLYHAIAKDRAKDLNGDGIVDPGGDFWTNDTFHTRDIIRQTVVDYFQAVRVFRAFDGHAWAHDLNGDGVPEQAGDWNADGVIDAGGPNVPFYTLGTSMGGIVSTILGAMDPAITAATPISPGGGVADIGTRTYLSDVRKAAFLPILGPMIISDPVDGDPRYVNLDFMVGNIFEKALVPFVRLGESDGPGVKNSLVAGDRVRVDNLTTGLADEVTVAADLSMRLQFAANKGDALVVTVRRADGSLVRRVDHFEYEVPFFQGARYKVGAPLVAIQEGLGVRRNTPEMRRFFALAQMMLDPGDPVNYARLYEHPLRIRPEGAVQKNAGFYVTMGDMAVPAATGISIGRAAGIIGYGEVDPRYGMTDAQLLVTTHVTEALEGEGYFQDDPCHYHPNLVNFDIDDLSNGQHPADLPRLSKVSRPPECPGPSPVCDVVCESFPPLRKTHTTAAGTSYMRFPALDPRGQHAVDLPDPTASFDASAFVVNQLGLFLRSGGKTLSDHPCLGANDCQSCQGEEGCPDLPPPPHLDVVLP